MNRRDIVKLGVAGGVGALVLPQLTGCGPKVSFYVETLRGALVELKEYAPQAAALIDKALKAVDDFDAAYKAGKFVDATAIFANLADVVSQIANDVGITDTRIKAIVAIAGVALHAIAALLKSQETQPAVKAARARATATQARQASVVDQLGSDEAIDAIYKAVKP